MWLAVLAALVGMVGGATAAIDHDLAGWCNSIGLPSGSSIWI